jgi:hypothetical protein
VNLVNRYQIKLNAENKKQALILLRKMIENNHEQTFSIGALSGTVNDTGSFVLTIKARGAAASEFVGQIEEAEDGVYLIGYIQPRKQMMRRIYGLIAMNSLLGLLMFLSGNPIFQVFSVLFFTVPWLNVSAARKGNYLKSALEKKFR